MKTTNKGLNILKEADSTTRGRRVILTRKTDKRGTIKHGVVLEDKHTGLHYRVATYHTIAPAWQLYKTLRRVRPA